MKSSILPFLEELNEHNNREWFQENKSRYQEAKESFDSLVNRLIPQIQKFDPSIGTPVAKDCVFRIYRDIRFSKDKTPYKTHFGAYIAKGGRKSNQAGYYIHVDANDSFLAGGMYTPPPDTLKKVRQEIMYNIEEFKSIINDKQFHKYFTAIYGEKLSRPPKDFPADFPDIELLKFKSYTVMHSVDPASFSQDEFITYTLQVYKALLPFNRFLNKALD